MTSSAPSRCASCRKPLASETGEITCHAAGCEELICSQCDMTFYRCYCRKHAKKRSDRLSDARIRLQSGEFDRIVEAEQASARESSYLDRFDQRIGRPGMITHPISGARYAVRDGHDHQRFPSAQSRNSECAFHGPTNGRSLHTILGSKNQPVLIIEARVLARVTDFTLDGFDCRPLGFRELSTALDDARNWLSGSHNSRDLLLILASVTGWEKSHLYEWRARYGFDAPHLTPIVVDLHENSIFCHWHDHWGNDQRVIERFDAIADLVGPPGELDVAIRRIQDYNGRGFRYEAISSSRVASELEIRPNLVCNAFRELAKQGEYELIAGEDANHCIIKIRR